jgi:mRNA-degrading endonuclease toxin of MazEF toxin-antitoxin module
MKRGDVYWADLEPRRSRGEQGGSRPFLVLSDDVFTTNPRWTTVMGVPITSSEKCRTRGPAVVALPAGSGGLKKDSFAICYQATTLGKEKLTRRLGSLASADLKRVEIGLLAAYGMLE